MPFPNLPKWLRFTIAAALVASVTAVPLAILGGLAIAELRGWEPPVWNLKGVGCDVKHGYVGDLRDYAKLTLLRRLGGAVTISVCWMLTPDDGGADGRRIEYLHNPIRWRGYDPCVWDFFCWTVWGRHRRHLSAVERSGLLPHGTRFYRWLLPANGDERTAYFNRYFRNNRADLVFFDPDNGIEVATARYGAARSNKYVYWREIERAYRAQHSVLIYQTIPRRNREVFTQRIVGELMQHTGGADRLGVRGPSRVVPPGAARAAHWTNRRGAGRGRGSLGRVDKNSEIPGGATIVRG